MKQLLSKAVFAAAGLVALTCVAMPASAQSSMRVNVPFAFMVGRATLPAGDYRVQIDPASSVMRLLPQSSTATYAVLLAPAADQREGGNSSSGLLRFEKRGEQYVLGAVWRPDHELGSKLVQPKSTSEAMGASTAVPSSTIDLPLK